MTVISEGGVFIPRKIGWAAVLGGFGFLISLAVAYGDARANITRDIETLRKDQLESKLRGDDIRAQLRQLQEMRLTVAKMEERQRSQDDVLREIRELARKR